MLLCVFSGTNVKQFFSNEIGGHRFQRIPPTETKGRVHTSSITVAVIEHSKTKKVSINPKELEITTTMGSGPGGQHRNRTQSCVTVKHKPTGITIREDGRSQHKNKEFAINEVNRKVQKYYDSLKKGKEDFERRGQIGSGSRGEKIRTYNVKNNRAVDHRNKKKIPLTRIFKGEIKLLH